MISNCPFARKPLSSLVAFAIVAISANQLAIADTVDLGTIGGSGSAATTTSVRAERGTAASVAPTQSNLNTGEPQSIISRTYIEESTPITGNFNTITGIAPSVATTPSTNGPGLSDQKMSLRGFSDGEYNVTFDGIPFGDTNGPTHHSTAYFPAPVIGGMVIERGPGNASNIGFATYGGSVNILSKAPSQEQSTSIYGSLGTWGTQLVGAGYESGRMAGSDATLQVNVQHLQSNTYLTFQNIYEENLTIKYQRPVGEKSLLTVFASPGKTITDNSDTGPATIAQMNAYGRNFGADSNPASQSFSSYNTQVKTTDFEYIRIQSDLGSGLQTDNNTYSYAYTNNTIAGNDFTKGTTLSISTTKNLPNGTIATSSPASTMPNATDVPGYLKLNEYRVYGDVFKATQKYDSGLLRAGVWYEYSNTHRHNLEADLSTQNTILQGVNGQPAGVVTSGNFAEQFANWHQYQPFVEYEWAAAPGLTITPGFKYMDYSMNLASASNQKAQIAQNFNYEFKASLPFLTINQKLTPTDSVYFQYAQGMQVPYLQYGGNGSAAPQPQTSTNYQIGAVHKENNLILDADIYYIDIENYMINVAPSPYQYTNPQYANGGGAVYKGIETEATYMMGKGYALYANYTINSAMFKGTAPATVSAVEGSGPTPPNPGAASTEVPKAPNMTAAIGLLYNMGPWNASLIFKRVGDQLNSTSLGQIPYYDNTDVNIAYTIKGTPGAGFKNAKVQLSVFNLDNHQNLLSASGCTNFSSSTCQSTVATFQAPRSYMISGKADF